MIKSVQRAIWFSIVAILAISACSQREEPAQSHVQGVITVADSIDSSGNFEGIGISIIKKDSANADADTLFYAETDTQGVFSGTADVPERRQYAMYISRNGRNIGRAGVILAAGDTVKISAELPGFSKTLQIQSDEHEAFTKYERVDRSFQRVAAFARSGRITGDSLITELKKWPDIYWQVYEEYPATLAGSLSAKRAVVLLNEWDKPAMMKRIRQIQGNDNLVYMAATYGKAHIAAEGGLEASLAYLDTLKVMTQSTDARMRIAMERINILYDSARTEQARTLLESFKETYDENKSARQWAESMAYDLNYLSPGDPIPEFSFTSNGEEISREKMKGRPYLLEITSLVSPVYQQQYDRTVVIHSIYKNYNFEVITIPLDTSSVTVDAFFQERMRPWPVASAKAFDANQLQKTFNIFTLPTRFLVNKDGKIARRYVGSEYDDIIQGIQQIMNQE